MATGKKDNVLVGAAAVFLNDTQWTSGGTAPTLPAGKVITTEVKNAASGGEATAAGLGTGWRYVGWTQEGLEVSYEPDFGEVEVDQELDSVLMFKQGMRVTANTTFAEATLENLLVVWAQATNTLRSTGTGILGVLAADEKELNVESGALGDEPVERQLFFAGKAPRVATKRTERVYWAKRVLSVDTSAHALRRNEATVFPVSFRLMPTGESGANYGVIRDRAFT